MHYKKFYICDIKRNVMSSVVLNRVEESLSKYCLCNALTYIAITPPRWQFEIKPKSNSQKSYLTKTSQSVLSCFAMVYCVVSNFVFVKRKIKPIKI